MSAPTAQAEARPLRIAFVFMSLYARLRLFGSVIEALLDRGHTVHLIVEDDREHSAVEEAWLGTVRNRPGFSMEVSPALRSDRWYWPAVTFRRAAEYVRWHRPEYADREWFRDRAGRRSPRWVRAMLRPRFMRTGPAVAALEAGMRPVERAIPIGRHVRTVLERTRPELLLLCPDLSTGSLSSVYIRVAQELGIPTVACIASWDNLTSKQLLGVVPDAVFVWNRIQEREAREIHGIPADNVVVTGAQCFDQWFDWTPSPREEFCARAGLDPSRPYILYVAGALAHTAPPELDFVQEWLHRLRESPHRELREVGVLLRPHPQRSELWSQLDTGKYRDVVMWPPPPVPMPTSQEARAGYFDSIYHSTTVVGLNTTAMIEAAIVGRSVHTLLLPDYHDTQRATVHFDYLFTVGGGILQQASSFAEHEEQLAMVLSGSVADAEEREAKARRFVEEFVRPYGLDEPATPRFVDGVERIGERPAPPPARRPPWVLPLRGAVVAGVYVAQPRELARAFQVRARRLLRH